jgi:putative ABC transport system ATP-binding protein
VESVLEVRQVTKVYEQGAVRVRAVDSVSLSLTRGQAVLIMGPSGSGKTTLLSIMGCILRPTSGEVVVDGQVVSRLGEDALPDIRRKYFGFVFQSFNLFSSLTAQENVELALRLKRFDRRTIHAKAFALLESVGLENRASFYPRDLSGGEKQRVAFARALAGDPAVILADEPTANLDSATGQRVLALLRELAENSGKAVAVVSHDPRSQALADRIIVLEDGRVHA